MSNALINEYKEPSPNPSLTGTFSPPEIPPFSYATRAVIFHDAEWGKPVSGQTLRRLAIAVAADSRHDQHQSVS